MKPSNRSSIVRCAVNSMDLRSSLHAFPSAGPLPSGALAEGPGYLIAGTGAPVVMLHSSLSSKSQWTALAERLASRFCMIAIDLCGYGDNPVPAAGASFTLDDEAELVANRLDGLVEARTRIHFVGHSYGGLVALRFAQIRSERVASLALYEPVAFRILDNDDSELADMRRMAQRLSHLVATGRRLDAARAFVDFWSGGGTYASLPLPIQVSIARHVDKLPLDFQAALSWPLSAEELRAIVAPTLLLVGNRGPAVVQRIHAHLTRVLPNRGVGSFNAGHMGPITDPHRINPSIEAFLDICARRDAGSTASRTEAAAAE
jgi:pimeloyl-ACP methyl ester carboxylesterase